MDAPTAVIMAGGQGTRLRPLTLTRPKPLVEVLGRPVIDWLAGSLVKAGIRDLVLTTGYRGEDLERHVDGWSAWRTPDGSVVAGAVNQEATPMGTAGSVKLLEACLGSTFIVGSGDNVATFDVPALLEAHRSSGAKVTMALWEVEDPSEFGIVGLAREREGEVDGELRSGWIRRFLEKPAPDEAFSRVINAGLYILEPEVLEHVPAGTKYDFSRQLFPHLLEMGWPMYAALVEGLWFDVGHPRQLLAAERELLATGDALGLDLPEGERVSGGLRAPGALVDTGASLESSVVLAGARVAVGARMRRSLAMAGARIEGGASLEDSIVGRDSVVGAGAQLLDCVIGDAVEVPAGVHWVGRRWPESASD